METVGKIMGVHLIYTPIYDIGGLASKNVLPPQNVVLADEKSL